MINKFELLDEIMMITDPKGIIASDSLVAAGAGMSRILEHINSGNPFGFVSAFKSYLKDIIPDYPKIEPEKEDYDPADPKQAWKGPQKVGKWEKPYIPKKMNVDRNGKLKEKLTSLGYGLITVKGNWNILNDDGKIESYDEDSFFVVGSKSDQEYYNKFRNDLINMQFTYKQDSIIYGKLVKDNIYDVIMTDKKGKKDVEFTNIKITSDSEIKKTIEKMINDKIANAGVGSSQKNKVKFQLL
jgi:CRISPR/Cas system-associated protein endoribonuclease Cas2